MWKKKGIFSYTRSSRTSLNSRTKHFSHIKPALKEYQNLGKKCGLVTFKGMQFEQVYLEQISRITRIEGSLACFSEFSNLVTNRTVKLLFFGTGFHAISVMDISNNYVIFL